MRFHFHKVPKTSNNDNNNDLEKKRSTGKNVQINFNSHSLVRTVLHAIGN